MEPQEAFRKALAIDSVDGRRTSVLLGSAKDAEGDREFRRLVLGTSLRQEFEDRALAFLAGKNVARAQGDIEFAQYEPGERPESHQVRFAKIADDLVLKAFFDALPDAGSVDAFVRNDDILKKVRFFVTSVSSKDGRRLRLFHTMSRGKVLVKTNKIIATFSGEKFESILDSDPLMFDPKYQIVADDEYVFIFGHEGFHQIFDFYEGLKEYAEATLDEINKLLPITKFDGFKGQVVSNKRRLRRLRDIALKGHFKKVSISKIKETIKEYELNVKVEKNAEGVEQIVFDEKNCDEILKLLEDQFVASGMTGVKYEANSKREIKAKR